MGLFDFIRTKPKELEKETVKLFDKDFPLRIIKGKITGYEVQTWTRHFDKNDNILRYGDGNDDKIMRHQDYQELELYLKTIHFDGYMHPGHHENKTTIYFERATLFDNFSVGDTITYIGLFLKEGVSWTDYFLYNHNNRIIERLYFIETVNKQLFGNKYSEKELGNELDNRIEKMKLK